MKHPKPPCRKDCPRRDGECHAKCEEWLNYEKLREYYYIVNNSEKMQEMELNLIDRDRYRKLKTRRIRKKRRC